MSNSACTRDRVDPGREVTAEPRLRILDPSAVAVDVVTSAAARLLLVDEHILERSVLRVLLERHGDFQVVGDVASVKEALQLVRLRTPDVVITDIRLPQGSGLELAIELRRRRPSTRVLVLTGCADLEYVKAALWAGARGYVLKSENYAELARAIRMVLHGELFLSVREPSLPPAATSWGSPELFRRTTPCEREVLMAIGRGATNKEIARDLRRSIKTIAKHRSNVMRKLDLHCTADLTLYAYRQNLLGVAPAPTSAPEAKPAEGIKGEPAAA